MNMKHTDNGNNGGDNGDGDVMSKIRVLREEQAPQDLYARIMTVVPHLPQAQAMPQQAPRPFFQRFFSQWNYAIGIKFAALAIVAVMGFYAGHINGAGHSADKGFSAIVTGDIGWED